MSVHTAQIFDENWEAYEAWFDKHLAIFRSEIKAIKKVIPSSGQGLEIGVGTARFASVLLTKFGLDPSWNMLKAAREREVQVVQGVGEFLPFKNESFHFVLIVVTICFVSDVRKVLRESARVLKKEGVLILGIIDKESSWGRHYESRAAHSKFYRRAHLFSSQNILNLLKDIPGTLYQTYQTLLHPPPKLTGVEEPERGFGQGGFVVFEWRKK